MWDAIIVGARCAGSPLAMLLARRGYRVLAVDKARFPSDTVSTHLIWHAALARARRWGLLDRINGLGAPPIHTCRFDIGKFEIAGCPPPLDGIDYAVAPRRTVLDKLLVDAAKEAGAEVREGCHISEVTIEDGRVTGIRGRNITETARIVVGADGAHSLVAHAVKSPKYNTRPSTACAYYAYWRGGPRVTDFETYWRPEAAGAAVPTNDGKVCVVAGWVDSYAKSPQEGYRRVLESVPRLREFHESAEQVEPLAGMRELPGYFRKASGEGWALAGDAGYHKHPLSAQGITDAFRDADLLSEAIHDGLSGRRELAQALADYERQRNEAVTAMYESTCDRAQLEPFPPIFEALLRALRHSQAEADRFFGTDAGTVSMAEFFAPENVERIVRSAPRAESAG